jgi:hypothetical protein
MAKRAPHVKAKGHSKDPAGNTTYHDIAGTGKPLMKSRPKPNVKKA